MAAVLTITNGERRVVVNERPDGLYHYIEQRYWADIDENHVVWAGGWQTCATSGLFPSVELAESDARQSVPWLR